MQLIKGTSVVVQRRTGDSVDSHGNTIYGDWQDETVENVLAQRGSTSELDSERPEGVSVAMTFHFPKTFTASLMGCRIVYGGYTYSVIGDPQPYMDENTPAQWNRPVECEVSYG